MIAAQSDGFSQFASQQFGLIQLRFANSPPLSTSLVASQNIREWKLLDDQTVSITSDPSTREVWRTESNHGGVRIVDMLTIDLGSGSHSTGFSHTCCSVFVESGSTATE